MRTTNPIVLVLVVLLVLENAETGCDIEEENDDEDETPVHGEQPRYFLGADHEPRAAYGARLWSQTQPQRARTSHPNAAESATRLLTGARLGEAQQTAIHLSPVQLQSVGSPGLLRVTDPRFGSWVKGATRHCPTTESL